MLDLVGPGRLFALWRLRLLIPRQDGLDEGILQQASDDRPQAELWLIDSTAQRDNRGNFSSRAAFQNLPGDAHEAFIQPAPERLLRDAFGLATHLDSAKERLDIARQGAVLRPQLRIHRELSGGNIESAMSTHEILHARHVDALDLRREIHVRAARLGLHLGCDTSLPAAHEAPPDAGDGWPLTSLVAQMFARGVGVREHDPVGRAGRLVHESKGTLDDFEPLDSQLDARLVCDLLRRLGGLLRTCLFYVF